MAMEGEQGGGVGISALLMQMGEWIWSEKTIWVVEISGRRGKVELSICLYPQHQLTTILDPSSLLLDLVLNEKAPPGINFLPLILAAPQWKPYFYIKYSPRIAPDNISRFHRTLEALFMCLLLPFLSKLWGIPFGQLPNYLKDGVACFLNMGTLSTGMREDWVAKNAKQLAPKPVDMSVGSNNLVEDGARGSDASYGGGSCSSSGKIPWGRF
ncbi:hypothetical protein TB2_022553 [Malus domestica]